MGVARHRLVGGVIAALLLGGCGSAVGSGSASSHHQSRSQKIIADFIADEHAVEKVLLTLPAPNPNDPRLPAHIAGPHLAQVRAYISDVTNAGDVIQGSESLGHPKLVSVSKDGKAAVVSTCAADDTLVETPLGQPVRGALGTPNMDGLQATLRLIQGHWLEWNGTAKEFPYKGGHGTCPGF